MPLPSVHTQNSRYIVYILFMNRNRRHPKLRIGYVKIINLNSVPEIQNGNEVICHLVLSSKVK